MSEYVLLKEEEVMKNLKGKLYLCAFFCFCSIK